MRFYRRLFVYIWKVRTNINTQIYIFLIRLTEKYFRVFMDDQFVFRMSCSFRRPLKIQYNLVTYLFVIYNRTREKKKTHLHTTSDINYIRYQQYCKIIWRPLFFLHKKLSMSFIWGILWTVWPLHINWCVSRVFPIKKQFF